MKKQGNRLAVLLLGIVTGAGIWMVVHRLRQSGFAWDKFAGLIHEMDWWWLAAAIFFILLTYIGRALRWEVLLRPVKPRPDRWALMNATVIGFTAVVLFGRAGELVRPYLIASKEKVSFPSQLAAWVLERLYDLLVVLALFGYALTTVDRSSLGLGPHTAQLLHSGGRVVGIGAAFCLIALVALRQVTHFVEVLADLMTSRLPERWRVAARKRVHGFLQGLADTAKDQSVFALMIYTVLEWGLIALCYYCLFHSFPATADFEIADILLFLAFVSFGSIVQLPGVGGGMQLAAVIVLTEFFGISLEAATGMALLLWLITFVVIVPFGFAAALHEGISWRKLKEIEEQAAG